MHIARQLLLSHCFVPVWLPDGLLLDTNSIAIICSGELKCIVFFSLVLVDQVFQGRDPWSKCVYIFHAFMSNVTVLPAWVANVSVQYELWLLSAKFRCNIIRWWLLSCVIYAICQLIVQYVREQCGYWDLSVDEWYYI